MDRQDRLDDALEVSKGVVRSIARLIARTALDVAYGHDRYEVKVDEPKLSHWGDIITSEAFEFGKLNENSVIEVFGIDRFQPVLDRTGNDNSRANSLYVVEGAGYERVKNISSYDGDDPEFVMDGWRVRARRLAENGAYDPDGELIDFYETGSVMNKVFPEQIKTIGWMNLLDWD